LERIPRMKQIQFEDYSWLVRIWDMEKSPEAFAPYVVTKDENADGGESVRPFPLRSEKPYVWDAIDEMQREQILFLEKSRQLFITWAVCFLMLWVCKFQQNRLVFMQSKKEEDAANLVYNVEPNQARMSFMEAHLPEPLKSDVIYSYGKMRVLDTGSLAWGIPEGGDQIRSYTPSWVISDEAAFQPSFEQAYQAARAAIRGGAHFVAVSSANGGAYMQELLRR